MPEKRHSLYSYVIVSASALILVMGWGAYYSYGIFFEALQAEFGWTRALTSGVFSTAVIVSGLLGILTGRLSDRFGTRLVCIVCGISLGIGYALVSQIRAVWQLYFVYGTLIAIGVSGLWAPMMANVARWFVEKRGLMTGLVASGIGIGSVVVAPLASFLIARFDWRIAYMVIGACCLVSIVLPAQLLKRAPQQINQTQAVETGIKAQNEMKTRGFSFREAIRTKQFWIVCLIYFFFGFSQVSIMVHIVPHATGLGISAANAANILAIIGGASVPGRILMGTISDRIRTRSSIIMVLVLLSISMLFLLAARDLWSLYLFAALFGFAYGGLSALQSLTAAELFGLTAVGTIVGNFSFNFTIGGAIGPVIFGYIFDAQKSYNLAFLLGAILPAIAVLLALLLKPLVAKGNAN